MCEASGLPWHIVSVGQLAGEAPTCHDIQTIEPCGYVAPLEGRQFAHGILDCYSLVRDFYALELGITLSQYPGPPARRRLRTDRWHPAPRRHDPDAGPFAGSEPRWRLPGRRPDAAPPVRSAV
ncbi:hypothetical protein G6F24_017181 [Rhizopus arrhizus]|nr:hypothetical protein G6F24_017181 [Rhizopus arrhizus]